MDREGRGRRQGCITGIALQRSVEPDAARCGIAGAQAQMIPHRRLGVFACVHVLVDDSRIVVLHRYLVHLSAVGMRWKGSCVQSGRRRGQEKGFRGGGGISACAYVSGGYVACG